MQSNLHFYSKENKRLHPYAQELLLLNDEVSTNPFIHLKELRIGNLLNLNSGIIEITSLGLETGEKIGFKVIGLTLEEMVFNVFSLKSLSPLSLNKSVLSLCTISSDIRYEVKTTDRYGAYTTYLPQIKLYYKDIFIAELHYLHQLQNLHYYLTAQELKVSL